MKKLLWALFISMVPLIELRGAVIYAAAAGLPWYETYVICVIGTMIPVPFILLFIPKILDLLERVPLFARLVRWVRAKAEKNRARVFRGEGTDAAITAETVGDVNGSAAREADTDAATTSATACVDVPSADTAPAKRKKDLASFFGLLLFVAIPCPGTGAWTGSLVASLFRMPLRRALLAVTLGVLLCGVIMCLAAYGVVGFLGFIL